MTTSIWKFKQLGLSREWKNIVKGNNHLDQDIDIDGGYIAHDDKAKGKKKESGQKMNRPLRVAPFQHLSCRWHADRVDGSCQ